MSKKEWIEKSDNEDNTIIYIAGGYDIDPGAAEVLKACYWKIEDDNQERVDLESKYDSYMAYSMDVEGNNVYTCGFTEIDGIDRACYWINKKNYKLNIEQTTIDSRALSIKVKNGVIFTTGYSDGKMCYWINQNKIELNMMYSYTLFVEQISSSKHNLYIGGLNSDSQALLLKNGEAIKIKNIGEESRIQSLFVLENEIYAVGSSEISTNNYACLWKKNEAKILPDGIYANSVFVSGDDIYASGQANTTQACYWKNNDRILLPDSYFGIGNSSFSFSIFVYNDNAYVAGADSDGSGNVIAWYWTNGRKTIIDPSLFAGAFSIIVKSKG